MERLDKIRKELILPLYMTAIKSRKITRAALTLFLALGAAVGPSFAALTPNPESGFLGQLVAQILEKSHYNHHALNEEDSRLMLRNYIDSFDYNHLIFEKSDIDAFMTKYAGDLQEKLKQGDVEPAFDIFNKFSERLAERVELVKKMASEKMDFTVDESVLLDRHEAPWPATAEEGRNLWRLRVKQELLSERLGKTKPEEQVKTVTLRYERLLRSVREYDANDVLQSYLTSLTHAFDPHSDYLAAPQKENFDISMRLSLVGIGAVLRSEDGYAKIVSLVPGGPADVDKRLKPNDKIEAVAQGNGPFLEAVGMKLDRLVQMIRGEKGSTVRLKIIPADAINADTRVTVSLVRDEIKLTDQEARAKLIEAPLGGRSAKVGVIDLPSFYSDMKSGGEAKSTTRDMAKLITRLRKDGMEGLIIDLRRNGGGSLSEAVSLTELFIKQGPVVQVKDSRGSVKVLKDGDPETFYSGPLLVLTSRMSASASEIFAGALQDYGRAVIVGDKSTFGKGTVQSMLELSQYMPYAFRDVKAGALKLTIQKFYRVSGGTTQNRGVIPDIHLPSVADAMDMTESSYKNAMPYDTTDPADYKRFDSVSPLLAQLQKASAARVAAAREFNYIREDLARYKNDLKTKTISLNEKKRLAEKNEDAARDEARKKDRAKHPTPELKSTDVTLEIIDGTAKAAPAPAPVKSTATVAKKDSDTDDPYEKAPNAPDVNLEESVHILTDLIGAAGANDRSATAVSRQSDATAVP